MLLDERADAPGGGGVAAGVVQLALAGQRPTTRVPPRPRILKPAPSPRAPMTRSPEETTVCVLRIEGTNCEDESAAAFAALGCRAEQVHLKQLLGEVPGEERRLADYDALFIPGGFSAGDYVRAGAILAARMRAGLRAQLDEYINEGRPVLGVCNGFQVLVELGALPGTADGLSEHAEAVLHTNDSSRFECRPTLLRVEPGARTLFTAHYEPEQVVAIPSAHAEGKLLLPDGRLAELEANGQVAFRFCDPAGDIGAGYPWNPNGAPGNVAGITNPRGNVLGMMPHPERAFHSWQHADWGSTDRDPEGAGDGRPLFTAVVDFLCR